MLGGEGEGGRGAAGAIFIRNPSNSFSPSCRPGDPQRRRPVKHRAGDRRKKASASRRTPSLAHARATASISRRVRADSRWGGLIISSAPPACERAPRTAALNRESVSVAALRRRFIGVRAAEWLNELLCAEGFGEKARGERAWLPLQFACSTSYTLGGRRKGSFSGPGMGRESPFHTWLVGNFSSILCAPFAYDPFSFQRSL